ncbi:hypothetical protein, partial [Sulfitobacter sabulilitoris]|uniref:hypothetical protein n=1 Tax=Sulfitobacter sabulilitoris TaxID=2562655 RepID=UPI0014792235
SRHPEAMSFCDLIREVAQADEIVIADGPHVAALAFARPQCRVFVLLSNAPGTDFHRADLLGRLAGSTVISLAGWQVQGSAGLNLPPREAQFNLPLDSISAFFSSSDAPLPFGVSDILSGLSDLCVSADVLTGSWAVVAGGTPRGFAARLSGLRRGAVSGVAGAEGSALSELLAHRFFADYGRNLRSGFMAFADQDAAERAQAARAVAGLTALAGATGSDPGLS